MPNAMSPLLAGLDAGGTTFKCGLGTSDGELLAQHRVPVTSPEETIQRCIEYFQSESERLGREIAAMGIASFGPIDIDPGSPSYGTILSTPKPNWSGTDLRGRFLKALHVDVVVDTDVNGALAGELAWGAAQGLPRAAYVTVGTGLGAGIFTDGRFAGAPLHPEFGHIRVQRHPDDPDFGGSCSFHGDCLEGLASATAFMARYGAPTELDRNHSGWTVEAFYLAQACLSLSLSFRPERIILGGGLMLADHLIDLVREQYKHLVGAYLGESKSDIAVKIVTPALGDDAGLLGGIWLARALSCVDGPDCARVKSK